MQIKLKTAQKEKTNAEILTFQEAAAFMRTSENTFRKYVKEKGIPFLQVGKRRLFSRRALLELVEKAAAK